MKRYLQKNENDKKYSHNFEKKKQSPRAPVGGSYPVRDVRMYPALKCHPQASVWAEQEDHSN